jgi:hypothetical protein
MIECAGVAGFGKNQASFEIPAVVISNSYSHQVNGSFDNLPSKFLKRLEIS